MTTIDSESTVPAYSKVCVFCKHFDLKGIRSCAAFPAEKSIPLPIWNGENDHTQPYEGDDGILFERFNAEANTNG